MRYLALILIGIFLFSACEKSDPLSGTWVCREHYIEDMVGMLKLDLNKDGTVKLSVGNASGTYEVKDKMVVLNVTMFGSETRIELEKEGDKLVNTSPMGRIVYEKE